MSLQIPHSGRTRKYSTFAKTLGRDDSLPFLLVELTIWLLCAQKDTSFQLGENGKKIRVLPTVSKRMNE